MSRRDDKCSLDGILGEGDGQYGVLKSGNTGHVAGNLGTETRLRGGSEGVRARKIMDSVGPVKQNGALDRRTGNITIMESPYEIDTDKAEEFQKRATLDDEDLDPVFKEQLRSERMQRLKWRLCIACMAMRFLLDGIEYAIILPTLGFYLEEMKADRDYIGTVVAAYAFGGFLAGPIFGRLSDAWGIPKLVICFGCMLSIAGNLIYFVGTEPEYLTAARFLCGLSSGVEPVILGEIGKNENVKPKRRASLFSMLFTIRQAGILVGPVIVLLVKDVKLEVLDFNVNVNNVGGFISAVFFAICLLMFIFFFDVGGAAPPDSEMDEDAIEQAERINTLSECSDSDDGIIMAGREKRASVPDSSASAKPLKNFGFSHDSDSDNPRRKISEYANSSLKRNHSKTISSLVSPLGGDPSNLSGAKNYRSELSLNTNDHNSTPLLYKRNVPLLQQVQELTVGSRQRGIEGTISTAVETTKLVAHHAVNRLGSQLTLVEVGTHVTTDFHKYAAGARMDMETGKFGELLCEPVLIGLFATYAIYIQQATVETILTPTTDMILGWKQTENAYMLIAVGLECVVGFISIGPASRKLKDRGVLLLGTGAISCISLAISFYAPFVARDTWWLMPVFVSSVAAFVFFMPYLVTGAAAVLSRSVPPHRQATVQGLRTLCERFGQMIGPLLAAHALNWNLIWVFLPPGLHIFLLYAMCYFSKRALSEEGLSTFAASEHVLRHRHQQALKSSTRKTQ